LERALLAFNPMEGVATPLVTATGQDIYWPTVNDTTAAGEMVDINTTVTEGAITFGNITFKAFKGSSKSVMVPYELMQDSAFNMETFLAETLGERLGRLRAAQCATGAGTTAPTGIITAGSSAATTASASAITADEYITLLHGVNPAYRNAAMGTSWMFNDTTAMAIRKLKDGMGQYLWQPGLSADIPDRMFGWPVIINPALANIGANAKPVVFGALRKFVIRTVGEIRIVRDPYTYSAKDQTFFVAFMRFDTNLLNAGTNPVKFLTCHA
jgi:HK97 family phage major capsid protein